MKKMKMIEIKQGNRTIYKHVPEDYQPTPAETPQRDLTTGGATLFSFDMTEEQYQKIFGKKSNKDKQI